ncbi:MAG: hypothetical protein ABDI20_09820 [Candidatus Bipolaricaulaceae bacterium]
MEELLSHFVEEGVKRAAEEAAKKTVETLGLAALTGGLGSIAIAGAIEVAAWAAKKLSESDRKKREEDAE